MTGFRISRRAALAGALALPAIGRAQGAPLRLGVLTPLTGAGGFDGPRMLKAMESVRQEVNAAGGVLGRPVEFVVEDDQTNPEGAVRAARKLVDVDKVPVIMGTWASAVTSAVAPVCWESKTFLTTVSGADSITLLPHQGYLIRTQPNTQLQNGKHAEYIAKVLGAKRVYILATQAPFAIPGSARIKEVLALNGSEMVGSLIYEPNKTSYRSEVDQALRAKPDLVYLNSYAPDATILLRELFRAGFEGPKFSQSYAITPKVLESLPAEVTEKAYTAQPSSDLESPAYDLAKKRLGNEPDSYEAQATDWISLAVLAIAKAGEATGTAIKDNVRKICQGEGTKVYSAVEGLTLLKAGKEVNYEGASGPCDFTEIGDIKDCKFRYQVAEKGKFKFLAVS